MFVYCCLEFGDGEIISIHLKHTFLAAQDAMLLVLVCAILTCSVSGSAKADYLSIAVTVTCDQHANKALVRFGYGDDGDPPKFSPTSDRDYRDLSTATVELPGGPEQDEASCIMPDGREVRVRKGYAPVWRNGKRDEASFHKFSVWVGKIRIVHGDRLYGIDSDVLPFGVSVGPEGFRRCYFEPGAGYSLTNYETPDQPAPIQCENHPSSIIGPVDKLEYPSPGFLAKSSNGSISFSRSDSDDGLCKILVESKAIGGGFDADDIGEKPEIHWEDFMPFWSKAKFDLLNSGVSQWIFRYEVVDAAHDTQLLLVAPQRVTLAKAKEVVGSLRAPDADAPEGWFVFSAARTEYRRNQHFHMAALPYRNGNFLLAGPSASTKSPDGTLWSDPAAILLKPRADGSLLKVCTFYQAYPHF